MNLSYRSLLNPPTPPQPPTCARLNMPPPGRRPLEPSLQGADVVLQSEDPQLVNNAQMASSAGHPLWREVMAAISVRARQGMKDPLHATGPHMLTQVLRVSAAWHKAGPWPEAAAVLPCGHWVLPCGHWVLHWATSSLLQAAHTHDAAWPCLCCWHSRTLAPALQHCAP
jgi:hypothetical protein